MPTETSRRRRFPRSRTMAKRKAAADDHPGLCGYCHTEGIGNVGIHTVIDRSDGDVIAERMRNQVSSSSVQPVRL